MRWVNIFPVGKETYRYLQLKTIGFQKEWAVHILMANPKFFLKNFGLEWSETDIRTLKAAFNPKPTWEINSVDILTY